MESVLHREMKNAFYDKALVAKFRKVRCPYSHSSTVLQIMYSVNSRSSMESQKLPNLLASGSRTVEALSDILSALRHLKSLIDEQVLHTCAGNVSTVDDAWQIYLTTLTISHSNVGAAFKGKILSTAGKAKV